MTTSPPQPKRPSSRLVPHEIRFTRKESGLPIIATVQCERRNCILDVEGCGYCERFARIDAHEAGYVMLCRSTDEEPDAEPR